MERAPHIRLMYATTLGEISFNNLSLHVHCQENVI